MLTSPPAFAVPEPDMSSITAEVPTGDVPKPVVEMEQAAECQRGGQLEDVDISKTPAVSKAFRLDELHKYGSGKGVTVAIIDSGVTPNPRLKNLKGGGDYVMGEDGLSDCDRHGTLIAGIIAAQPSEDDDFRGIAPDVNLISIRQTSAAFEPKNDEDKDTATSTLATLAGAIVRATNLGADIINMSVTSCYEAEQVVDTNDLKAAIDYAYQKNVVLVTAAGNADATGCGKNPGFSTARPQDERNWEGVKNISMPSYYTPYLLSVGGSTLDGMPYTNTMSGPWVDIAAPAERITSLDPFGEGTLVNAALGRDEGEKYPITGTSFAAAYVSGLAALIIEQNPRITPDEVAYRITSTARSGGVDMINSLGSGVIDPVAALTHVGWGYAERQINMPAPVISAKPDPHAATKITVMIIGVTFLTMAVIACVSVAVSRVSNPKKRTYDSAFTDT